MRARLRLVRGAGEAARFFRREGEFISVEMPDLFLFDAAVSEERSRMRRTNVEPVEILLVEDNPGDARLAEEALKDGKVFTRLHHVTDGVEAMRYLRRQGEYAEASLPDLVLLDLNLPKKDGREVLAEIKGDPGLRFVPVVVLTTSEAERDLVRTYDLHANAFIVKPIDLDRFIEVVQAIENFWFTIVKLPRVEDG